MNFIHIEGGYFNMGNEVEVDDFYLADMLFTQRDWLRYLEEEDNSDENPSYFKGDLDRPVENRPWYTVQYFIDLMNDKEPGMNYRLPTEMEWEYAARGGRKSKGYAFSGSNELDKVAWYLGNSDQETHPVGLKEPNELGLYDMSGNVWEWCADLGGKELKSDGHLISHRVIRGGGWLNDVLNLSVFNRIELNENAQIHFVGFRVARDG